MHFGIFRNYTFFAQYLRKIFRNQAKKLLKTFGTLILPIFEHDFPELFQPFYKKKINTLFK